MRIYSEGKARKYMEEKRFVYADHSATTRVSDLESWRPCSLLKGGIRQSSSIYSKGREAKVAVERPGPGSCWPGSGAG